MSVCVPVLPDYGEDSFVLGADPKGVFLCVADGCGGLGSRRYPALNNQTGAAIASRLAVECFENWARERKPMPRTPQEGKAWIEDFENALNSCFQACDQKYGAEKTRIMGSMQRRLPTTLCAALVQNGAAGWRECCFLWAGDSRGYVLGEKGLHQCTQDHLRGTGDPFETLYHDVPLSNHLSADQPARLSLRRMRAMLPCVVIAATDGAYSALPTPMEFEMLLLDTLKSARSWSKWQKRLSSALKRIAQDDVAILLSPCGISDFEAFRQSMSVRREELKKQFVTSCRRHKNDLDYLRGKWKLYREQYDWTEEGATHERMDWRI